MEFRLKSDFIELDNLLKVLELVSAGAEARQSILAGEVKVNSQPESRIRRKIRPGDLVEFRQQAINVIK
jgi:ribosome-associated protein